MFVEVFTVDALLHARMMRGKEWLGLRETDTQNFNGNTRTPDARPIAFAISSTIKGRRLWPFCSNILRVIVKKKKVKPDSGDVLFVIMKRADKLGRRRMGPI